MSHPESVDPKIEKMVKHFHWDALLNPDLVRNPQYLDFLQFLYDSRLLYSIRGYQSSQHGASHELSKGICLIDQQPHILKEGVWTSWREIITQFQYDQEQGITPKDSSQSWNYLYPNGLIPQKRYNWVGIVHQLSHKELDRLHAQGEKFSTNQPNPSGIKQVDGGYLQVFTSGESPSDRGFGHAGIRLIDSTGNVFSLGFERPMSEVHRSNLFSLFATYNVGISSLDFTEFKKFDVRRVTTIPVSMDKFAQLLKRVNDYANRPLRLNFLSQNCTTLAADLLQEADVSVNVKSKSGATFLFHSLAPKGVRKIALAVRDFFAQVPDQIIKPILFLITILTYPLSLLCTVIKNLVLLILGAGKDGAPLPAGTADEAVVEEPSSPEPGDKHRQSLTSFRHLFNHWTDLFKDLPVSMPHKLADWQKMQPSTETFQYKGPQFYIVGTEPSLQREKP
jgi:hypothetical protein